MSQQAQSIIIQTGGDPRQCPEFSAIRDEINKINHPARPEVNWGRIETLALTLFRSHGVDLQTAVYYSLARTQRHGLAGFTEASELLAGMVVSQWPQLWPPQGQARTEILEWFNARVGNQLRQHPFVSDDLRLVYRAERALQLLCDKLRQVELARVPRVENLLYLMQNTARRLEAEGEAARTPASPETAVPTLVYLSVPTAEPDKPAAAAGENAPDGVTVRFAAPAKSRFPALWGFISGVLLCLAMAAGAYLLHVRPLEQQLAALAARPEGAVQLWLSQPSLSTWGEQVTRLETLSPLAGLYTADRSLALARQRWPDEASQQAASQHWEETQLARLGAAGDGDSYFQLRQQLQALSQKLLDQEQTRGSLTISWLKTAVYRMQRELDRETPVEELLRQLSVAAGEQQPLPPALLRQTDERLNSLLSRYHQLTRQAAPAR
ncbi:VasL domain-containing protein [Erwiniaceae bacterium CAU 1747]